MKHADKLMHIAAGAFFGFIGLAADSPAAGIALALLAGLAREVWNRWVQGTRFDWLDLGATVLGGVLIVAVVG